MSAEDGGASRTEQFTPSDPAVAGDGQVPSTIGRYEVRRVVGSGGMGVVIAAHDPELGRQVAIKVLAREHAEARTRLLREAQAMARLSHANVVTVHEVLKVNDRAAIVMELVDGRDLAGWLAETPRGWRAIVDAFIQAGRGLAAAHKAGMVHRDFKPGNALIDRDGVVRVTDFGLVRASAAEDESLDPSDAATDQLDTMLTRTGMVLGTPTYMAPEQHERGAVDARTDQWAFACALYNALYKQRPFAGETYSELSTSVRAGALRPEPATTAVPRRIRAAIRRGLSRDPADRFATMDEMLAALTPPRRGWIAVGVVGGLAAAAVIAAVVLTRHQAVSCDGLDAPFAAMWNPGRAQAIRTQFASTGAGFAADAADRFTAALDQRRDAWAAMRTQACTDAQRGAISSDLLDRRMHCLDLRLAEVRTVVDSAAAADTALVATANNALARLPGVGECTDPVDTIPRPNDPAARAAIASAETDAARARALYEVGKFAEASPLTDRAVKVSDQTGWPPLAAKALYELGRSQSRRRDADHALATFDRAADAAARAKDDVTLAEALIERFYVLAGELSRVDDAFAGQPYIELAIERAGGAARIRGHWLSMYAVGLDEKGHDQDALIVQLEAEALWRQGVSPDNIALADCLNNEGTFRMTLGQLDEAKAIFENLLVTDAANFGAGNPELARRHYNLASIAMMQGDVDTALGHYEQAYSIRKAAGVVDWIAAYGLAQNSYDVGRWAASLPPFIEAEGIMARTIKDSQYLYMTQMAIGVVYIELGKLDEARPWLDKALATAKADHSTDVDHMTAAYALLAVAAGDVPGARRIIAESRAMSDAAKVARSPSADLAELEIAMDANDCAQVKKPLAALVARGEEGQEQPIRTVMTIARAQCQLATGKAADKQAARDALDARLTEVEKHEPEPGAVAQLRFALARALIATGGDRDRARTLAEGARDGFATLGDPGAKRAAEVTRWLATQ